MLVGACGGGGNDQAVAGDNTTNNDPGNESNDSADPDNNSGADAGDDADADSDNSPPALGDTDNTDSNTDQDPQDGNTADDNTDNNNDSGGNNTDPPPAPRLTSGRWEAVQPWPLIAIHSVMASDGRILTYGTTQDGYQTGYFVYDIWDPTQAVSEGHQTLVNATGTDIFCSAQINNPKTGETVLFGGDTWNGYFTLNEGNASINSFNPQTGSLQSMAGMNRNRWYATAITRADGSIYIQGGKDADEYNNNGTPELWRSSTGARSLSISTDDYYWWYPRLFLLSDGRIFGFDTRGEMFLVDADLSRISSAGSFDMVADGRGTSAVMYRQDQILVFGGDSTRAQTIDLRSGWPIVADTGRMHNGNRHWVNATLLPDGRVFANGGANLNVDQYHQLPLSDFNVAYSAEVWEPATGQWTSLANASQPRLYHSSSILLADGRILTAGGGAPGPQENLNAEIYVPDYLIRDDGSNMPRRNIYNVNTLGTDVLKPGNAIEVQVDDATQIRRMTLLKTGSVTHSFNTEQRLVELSFETVSGNRLQSNLPGNSAVLTPGYYLLTVLDVNGVPSRSAGIRVLPH